MPSTIKFFQADRPIPIRSRGPVKQLLMKVFRDYKVKVDWVHFIFCSDITLLQLNKDFLKHDYYTDILTFPLQKNPVQAEVHISTDRVKDNAVQFEHPFSEEVIRVMIHGVLHLCGEKDKSASQVSRMRALEDKYLKKVPRET